MGGILIGFERCLLLLCAARLKFRSPFAEDEEEATFEEDASTSLLAGFMGAVCGEGVVRMVGEVDFASGTGEEGGGEGEEGAEEDSAIGGADGAALASTAEGESE